MRLLAVLSMIISILTVGIRFPAASILKGYQATMVFDLSEKTGKVKKGASGYLYGIAENGVPSAEMVESVDVKTIVQKVPGGLQHPIGDIDNADPMLKSVDYEMVYLQDIYDTWYYLDDEIMEMRSRGTYDWQELLDGDYFPKIRELVGEMSGKSYAAPVVYCLFNECDNGLWFGETMKDDNPENRYGVWCSYNETGRDNFNSAWKQAYDLVKSVDSNALTGGPGFCDYDSDEIRYFLSFCKENNCLPDIMIYHELGEDEAYFFDDHIKDYRKTEKELGIDEIEIIISEYGMMSENGYPGEMIKYITQFEDNKVYGDSAYWRLADNLNDTCADDNSPNAQWWLMRWYTEMKGETVKGENLDILSSNLENYFKYKLDSLSFRGFMGIASVSDDGGEIDAVCGGRSGNSSVVFKNLKSTSLYGKTVRVTVEETVYKGLYGVVSSPVTVINYTVKAGKSICVPMEKTDAANAYHIVIREARDSDAEGVDARPERYEFENGRLTGGSYTYDSYCPASSTGGNINDVVGGMENDGDGVEIKIKTQKGDYILDFIYGNSNDAAFGENGKQNPDGRVNTKVRLVIDGEERIIELPNTIKSEYTSCYSVLLEGLKAGEHTVRAEHVEGTYILDSLVVTPYTGERSITVLEDEDRTDGNTQSFLAVAPVDGYYLLKTDAGTAVIDGTVITFTNGSARAFLKRGLNYIDVDSSVFTPLTAEAVPDSETDGKRTVVTSEEMELFDGAVLSGGYIENISSESGYAEFGFDAPEEGRYRLTFRYANNAEGGVHDYNVDLIERYVTVSVNGSEQGNVFCRNTYSRQTVKTVTFTAVLDKGNNVIRLSNNGEYIFNSNTAFIPDIYSVTVSPAQI